MVYHESWVITLGISFPKNWQKNIFFSVGKKSFLGGRSKWLQLYLGGYGQMITVLHRGYVQMITILHRGEGSLGTPKNDYVICARPLKDLASDEIISWYFTFPDKFWDWPWVCVEAILGCKCDSGKPLLREVSQVKSNTNSISANLDAKYTHTKAIYRGKNGRILAWC